MMRQRAPITNKIEFPLFPSCSTVRLARQKAIKHPTDEITAKHPIITLESTEAVNDTADNTIANTIQAIMDKIARPAWARITRNSDIPPILTQSHGPLGGVHRLGKPDRTGPVSVVTDHHHSRGTKCGCRGWVPRLPGSGGRSRPGPCRGCSPREWPPDADRPHGPWSHWS